MPEDPYIPFLDGPYDGMRIVSSRGGPFPEVVTLDVPLHPDEVCEVDEEGKVKRLIMHEDKWVTYVQEWRDPETGSVLVDPKTARPFYVLETKAIKVRAPGRRSTPSG